MVIFMETELLKQLLFLCPMLAVAGIVDGISGGGGLIALPSYMMAGLPISAAYGCNKMQSCLGTCASLAKYAKSGFLDIRAALPAALAAIAGSFISTQIMLMLDDADKRIIIGCAMIFVICLTLLSGKLRTTAATVLRIEKSVRNLMLCLGIGLLLGLYDGFFGPGGGTVAIMLFAVIFKHDMRVGSGNGKLIIVLSNLTALLTYILNGDVIYAIAIPCSIANIVGSYIGASLATTRGAKFVRKILLVVVGALVIRAVWDMFAK